MTSSNKGPKANAPKILLIAPQPAISVTNMNPQMDNTSVLKTQQLASFYQTVADEERCVFLDAAQYVSSSHVDGVHLDESEHIKLGKIIAKKVKQIII